MLACACINISKIGRSKKSAEEKGNLLIMFDITKYRFTKQFLYWFGSQEKSQSFQASIKRWAIFMAFRCWANDGPLIVVFGSFIPKTFWIRAFDTILSVLSWQSRDNCKKTFCGFSMGSSQYGTRRVYDLFVYFMTGTPEASTESDFMEKLGIQPATPGLQDIGLSPTPRRLHTWQLHG